jgi:hydantoinase/carbamoylase family amidase
MPISAERIQNDITAIARFTQTPGSGATRPTFSPAWRQARDYVQSQLEATGCKIRIDAAGNLHARPTAISWDGPAWLSGSHLDTVPNAGDYDGVVGVVAALEVLRAAREDLKVAVPLELVVWTESEGATFGRNTVGSRLVVGELTPEHLAALKNSANETYLAAGARHGVDPSKLASDRLRPHTVVGAIEIHVEQGPGLWNDDIRAACVSGVAARRQYRCDLRGAANDAGSTSMRDRLDALTGAAEIIVAMEKLALEMGHSSVITIGQISNQPNAINVVPQRVTFTIDFRCAMMTLLAGGDQSIRRTVEQIAHKRRLEVMLDVTDSQAAVELDPRVCAKMRRSAEAWHFEVTSDATSGQLHDAAILAAHVPAAMLFVPSRNGISHSPDEFTRVEDIATAATILLETVRDRRLE